MVVAPTAVENLPVSQLSHAVWTPSAALYLPAGHAVQEEYPEALANLPASQGRQVAPGVAEYVPALQGVQLLLTRLKPGAVQLEQRETASKAYLGTGQSEHTETPELDEYVPGGHRTHVDDEFAPTHTHSRIHEPPCLPA